MIIISFPKFSLSYQDTLLIHNDTTVSISIDSLKSLKKIERTQKAKKAFKFLSYFNYSDRGYGKQFSGVEKYEKYRGKKIGCIQIQIFKPFGGIQDNMTQTVTKGQKFGNKIHFKSKEWFVKGDVLFKEGETVNPTLFADTEKLLWDRKKFKDVRILLTEDTTTGNLDVLVYLQDKLSYAVSAGYSNNRVMINASTYNFFGLPNSLNLFTGINFNKYNIWAVGGTYRYDNIQASQINFKTKFIIERLNQDVSLSVNRYFF